MLRNVWIYIEISSFANMRHWEVCYRKYINNLVSYRNRTNCVTEEKVMNTIHVDFEEFTLEFLAMLQVINRRPLLQMRKHRLGSISLTVCCFPVWPVLFIMCAVLWGGLCLTGVCFPFSVSWALLFILCNLIPNNKSSYCSLKTHLSLFRLSHSLIIQLSQFL